MPVFVSFLRGVNVGGHAILKMDALRATYQSLGFDNVQSYVQSGNLVFCVKNSTSEASLTEKIQAAIQKDFGLEPKVMLRSTAELRAIMAANPFAKREGVEPNKLHVSFLAEKLSAEAQKTIANLQVPEEIHVGGRELYIYFPEGAGLSKLAPLLDRALKMPATARNWNTVTKMLAMAEALEG